MQLYSTASLTVHTDPEKLSTRDGAFRWLSSKRNNLKTSALRLTENIFKRGFEDDETISCDLPSPNVKDALKSWLVRFSLNLNLNLNLKVRPSVKSFVRKRTIKLSGAKHKWNK